MLVSRGVGVMIGGGATAPGRRRSWGRQHTVFEPPRPGAVPTALFCVSSTLNLGQVVDTPHGALPWRDGFIKIFSVVELQNTSFVCVCYNSTR